MIKSFLDLDVYKESFQLMIEIDELIKGFPAMEKFLLMDQMRRAHLSHQEIYLSNQRGAFLLADPA